MVSGGDDTRLTRLSFSVADTISSVSAPHTGLYSQGIMMDTCDVDINAHTILRHFWSGQIIRSLVLGQISLTQGKTCCSGGCFLSLLSEVPMC